MNKWKLIAGVVLVFVLGALAGIVGTGIFIRHHPAFPQRIPLTAKR